MPLGRYFVLIGGALVALLFLADWYMPGSAAGTNGSEVDKSIIRIHTMHRWPEAIAIDTSLPTIVPPPVMAAAESPAKAAPLEALAELRHPTPAVGRTAEVKPAATKKRWKAARTFTRRIAAYREAASADLFAAGW